MQKTHATDKSGEDPTECKMCGFRNNGHMADCPLANPTKHAPDCDGWGKLVGGPFGTACKGECLKPKTNALFGKIPHNAPRDYSPAALRTGIDADGDPHGLTERYLKQTERRFTGEPLTGFGGL